MRAVVDCFLFNDELDVLRHRLTVLDSVVTKFVLVEAPLTHQGAPKPLVFAENRPLFEPWLSKIEHVVATLPAKAASPRERERAQHAALGTVVDSLAPETLVLLGDVDEVPDPEVVRMLAASIGAPTRLHMTWAIYWPNLVFPQTWDDGTVAFLARDHDHASLALLLGRPGARWKQEPDPAYRSEAGWHYSWLGDERQFAAKVAAYPHAEFRAPRYSAERHVARLFHYGVDFLGRDALHLAPTASVSPGRARAELPNPYARRIYLAFTRLRRHLPESACAWFDRRPVALILAFGPAWLAAEQALPLARRLLRR